MFLALLLLLLLGAAVHFLRSPKRNAERAGTLLLVWVLVGYCGVPMLAIAVANLADPALAPGHLGFPAGNPFQLFLGWAYLGMAIVATLAALYRGSYLIGPALVWAVFFAGATAVHLADAAGRSALTHGNAAGVFMTHGLISVLLVGGLLTSGALRARG